LLATFSRRLQPEPGLVPPTSWSITPVSTLRSSHAQNRSRVQVLAVICSKTGRCGNPRSLGLPLDQNRLPGVGVPPPATVIRMLLMLRLKAAGITVTTWREERRESPRGDKAVQATITENPSPSGRSGMSAENPTALVGTRCAGCASSTQSGRCSRRTNGR
jgi:hypothetical protein